MTKVAGFPLTAINFGSFPSATAATVPGEDSAADELIAEADTIWHWKGLFWMCSSLKVMLM